MAEYPNWFTCYADDFFARHLSHLAGQPGLRFLQIGAFTGDASVWLLENILTGKGSFLVDVDTWAGSDEPEHEPFDWADVERTYDLRTSPWQPAAYCGGTADAWRVKFKGTSEEFFRTPTPNEYDFVYIDGDHTAPTVLSDAVQAFQRLKVGGILAFDDYMWKPYPEAPAHLAPGPAIDAFASCHVDHIALLEAGLQVWAKKTAPTTANVPTGRDA